MIEARIPFTQSKLAFTAAFALVAILSGGVGGFIAQDFASSRSEGMGTTMTGKAVRDYILENPEILPEAIKRLDARNAAALIGANRKAIEKPYAGSWEGNPNGDVTLVEFFDYACPWCRASLPTIAKLVAEDSRLKIVYREMPVLSEQGGSSWLAARVSMLAAKTGKYMAFHRAMFEAGPGSKEKILAAAARAGIDRQAAEAALADSSYDIESNNNIGIAQSLKVIGVPLLVVGNQMINTAPGYDALKAAVARARTDR